jgi:hypothetical protein
MAAPARIGKGVAQMDRWSDFGLLSKAAIISGGGGMIGMVIGGVVGAITGDTDIMMLVIALWFAPLFLWAICALASSARYAWPETTGCLALFIAVAMIFAPEGRGTLAFALILCPVFTAALAIMGKPAAALFAVGRR